MAGCPPLTLLVVYGPPGVGKSTLAEALGRELQLPVFDRDNFKDLIFEVLGWSDREWSVKVGHASWQLLTLIAERLLSADVSFILESNFRPGDVTLPRLRECCKDAGALAIEVHCDADPGVLWDRFEGRRNAGGRHPGHGGFEDRATFIRDLRDRPHGPIGLGDTVITVDTTTAWPDADEIASRVRRAVDQARPGDR